MVTRSAIILPSGELFSFVPSPIDAATEDFNRRFVVYDHYVEALRMFIEETYESGQTLFWVLGEEIARKERYHKMRPRTCDKAFIERELRSAWATEIVISQASDSESPEVVACANLWATVQSYYAIYHAAQAFTEATGWVKPSKTHFEGLRNLASIVESKSYFPAPWDSWCHGASKDFRTVPALAANYGGTALTPSGFHVSPLSHPRLDDCPDRIAMLLRTTRLERIAEAKKQWLDKTPMRTKQGKKYKLVPTLELTRIENAVHPTTLFDFIYRLRIRSNYRDVDAFILSDESIRLAMQFNSSLLVLVRSTLFLFEVGIARILGRDYLNDLADRFERSVGQHSHYATGSRLVHLPYRPL